ncbi:MAG TPA: dTDP-4-dehydrorhamnose reductase [Pseudacidobacterium sp.]|nr:dTDP-4-dehydrorhamnose reductase [Pseudacidobacterium sp.]
MSQRKFLLLGAKGQVGTELRRSFAGAGEVIACDRRQADLSQPEGLRELVREVRPDVILNAAAYTAVDRAESEPELAMTINATAPRVLAEEAAKTGALLVHYSTDYVFDGTKDGPWIETDATNPLSIYGKTKLAGERAIQEAGGTYLIFRTSWVFGPHGHNFLLTMLRLGKERPQLRIVDDQIGAPTSSSEIAKATRAVLEEFTSAKRGIYHMTCSGQTSWYGFARAIFADAPAPEIIPIPSAEYPTPAKRPRNSVLSNEKLKATFGVGLSGWQEALRQALQSL